MIWRRLRNLWWLSGQFGLKENEPVNTVPRLLKSILPKQQARIVEMKPIISDIPVVNDNPTQ